MVEVWEWPGLVSCDTVSFVSERLMWTCCHGSSKMKRWILVLLGITLAGVLLQVLLFLKDGPPPWLLPVDAQTLANVTLAPQTVTRSGSLPRQGHVTRTHGGGGGGGGPHAHHPYRFLLNEPGACNKRTELVMVVITAVNNTRDRQAVRDTWGSSRLNGSVSMVFLVGVTSQPKLQAQLVRESRQHHDIVQEDFVDSYRNLSLKSVALLKWVTLFCNSSKFVLKADDDMYINVSNLVSALRKEAQSHSTFVLGHVFTGARPVQNTKSKWYTPKEEFNEAVYPRYTSGTAYSMTTSAARELYAASAHVPVFWLEDIYITGLCARKAGVPVYHHGGFSYIRNNVDGCHFRNVISGHRYTALEKRTIFRKVNDPNLQCH